MIWLGVLLTLVGGTANTSRTPNDFEVSLFRDEANTLRLIGNPSPTERERLLNPQIVSFLDDTPTRPNLFSFGFDGVRLLNERRQQTVWLHVTDNLVTPETGSHSLRRLCIGFGSRMSQHMDSLIYRNVGWGESLIFQPAEPEIYALDRAIAYAQVYERSFVHAYAYIDEDDAPQEGDSYLRLTLRLNDHQLSKIPDFVYDFLMNMIIQDTEGFIVPSSTGAIIILANCYERLVGFLPDIKFGIANDREGVEVVANILFQSSDYIERTDSDNRCRLLIDRSISGLDISLTDHLLKRVGGLHFDYTNSRIGFFDPL